MGSSKQNKLNRLLQAIPRHAVVIPQRLDELGISPQLARKYVQNGWLIKIGSGAFARAGDNPDWRGGLYALQSQLEMSVHVGAVSALELHGRAHFLSVGQGNTVVLLSDKTENLPAWFKRYPWTVELSHSCLSLFSSVPEQATTPLACGDFSILVSAPERAILEEVHLVRDNNDIEHAVLLMEGLTTLRPELVQKLLEHCMSIKAKRLFLWAAESVGHSWFDELDLSKVELGTGKRQLYKGGKMSSKYLIMVPPQEDLPNV